MDNIPLSSLSHLKDSQKSVLRKGNIITINDLVLAPPRDLAKRCRVSVAEITQLVQTVCNNQGALAFTFQTLGNADLDEGQLFSIGDPVLDAAFGGGLRAGMIWEVVGESAAGKTQFALQSSLYVQLPPAQGGLGGSACYITTSAKLQTSRLIQIQQERGLANTSLEDIHTLSAPTIPILLNVLENQLPVFIETTDKTPSRKPVRLLIIDALAELFHSVDGASTGTLVERSQHLSKISSLLHRLACRSKVAVIILNEVVDAFDNHTLDSAPSENGLLSYSEQARWFKQGHSVYGENKKEASLGLVWANQVNARIMLTRTGRRRYLEEETAVGEPDKRQKTREEAERAGSRSNVAAAEQEPLLIRRLTVVFNSTGSPTSCDYIVTPAGVRGLPNEDKPPQNRFQEWLQTESPGSATVPPANPGPSNHDPQSMSQVVIPSSQDEEEYEGIWEGDEFYENIDWDSLEQTLSQAHEATT